MQLDVTYILRRLDFIDAAVSKLFSKEELDVIYMREKPTLEKAKEQRKKHFNLERVLEGCQGNQIH